MNAGADVMPDTRCSELLHDAGRVWSTTLPESGVPCLHWAGVESLLCDGRYAWLVGPWLSSFQQARLWCAFHGFDLTTGRIAPMRPGFWAEQGARFWRVLRSGRELDVRAYASHRARCRDCREAEENGYV